MIIIGFSDKTSKILPRIFCRRFRHVAVIVPNVGGLILYQFVRRGNIVKIPLQMRDIKILRVHGWRFFYLPCALPHDFDNVRAFTCVQMAKVAIRLRAICVQTPDALYKKLKALEL